MKIKDVFKIDFNNPEIMLDFFGFINVLSSFNNEKTLYLEYVCNRSGEKEISRFVECVLKQYNNEQEDINFIRSEVIGKYLETKFSSKWSKLKSIYDTNQDYIFNEDRTHVNTPNIERKREYEDFTEETPDITFDTKTERSYKNNETTVDGSTDGIYGFNSEESVGSTDTSGYETRISSGNIDDNKTFTVEKEVGTRTKEERGEHKDTRTGEETDTYRGRNGDFTLGRIVKDAVDALDTLDFISIVFADIDSVLTKPMYIW